jgi:DNA repair exonuclease SbcCD ATPase subunit
MTESIRTAIDEAIAKEIRPHVRHLDEDLVRFGDECQRRREFNRKMAELLDGLTREQQDANQEIETIIRKIDTARQKALNGLDGRLTAIEDIADGLREIRQAYHRLAHQHARLQEECGDMRKELQKRLERSS